MLSQEAGMLDFVWLGERRQARSQDLKSGGAISITRGGGGELDFFFLFLPFFPQTVYLKHIEVIEVCPTNLWKPFPMLKKKEVMVENERFFWSTTALQCERMRAKCKANALRCRMPAEFKANARQPHQDSWESCEGMTKMRHAHFCRPLPGSEPTRECEANARQARDKPAESAFLTAIFRVAPQSANKFVLVWQGF